MKKICKNCQLYNPSRSECSVVVLHAGEKFNIPVEPNDPCFFEQEYYNADENKIENFNEIKEIKVWVQGKDGKKGEQGIVKIEYPTELEMKLTDTLATPRKPREKPL